MSEDVLILLAGQLVVTLIVLWRFRVSRTVLHRAAERPGKQVLPPNERVNNPPVPEHVYVVIEGEVCLYEGDDLHYAKAVRKTHPGSTLIADGVNRG